MDEDFWKSEIDFKSLREIALAYSLDVIYLVEACEYFKDFRPYQKDLNDHYLYVFLLVGEM